MRIKYQITMEVEVANIPQTTVEDLEDYAEQGFKGQAYTRDQAVVNKVEVSKIGATGVMPTITCDQERKCRDLVTPKVTTKEFNGFKSLADKKVKPVEGRIFLEHNAGLNADLTIKATEGYMCGCGALVDVGTELHLCQKCHAKQCPNCFDYNNSLCEECGSK